MEVPLNPELVQHGEQPFVSVVGDKRQARTLGPAGDGIPCRQWGHGIDDRRMPLTRCAVVSYRCSEAVPEISRGDPAAPQIIPKMITEKKLDLVDTGTAGGRDC
ncbi:hypothetical protein GCM10023405_14250 [Streptomonospora salina]